MLSVKWYIKFLIFCNVKYCLYLVCWIEIKLDVKKMLKLFNNIYKINKNFLLNFYVFDFNKKYYMGFVYKKNVRFVFYWKIDSWYLNFRYIYIIF